MAKPVILTGLRANSDLHIGNYFGALLPLIDMAKAHASKYQINLFVPDLHSFTTPIDHGKLYEQTLHNLRVFAAAGLPLDQLDIHIYRQSFVSAHSELAWILSCFTGFGVMNHMTQFKDKSARIDIGEELKSIEAHVQEMSSKFGDNYGIEQAIDSFNMFLKPLFTYQNRLEKEVSVGLFDYPILMAADILLYGAEYVPVGDDQTQHLEFVRDIAKSMNIAFLDVCPDGIFTIPKPVKEQHEFFGKDQGLRIRDLLGPTKKMSKSDETGRGVIFLSDTPEVARQKIMGATTDSSGEVKFDIDNRPGISNLLQILALLEGRALPEVIKQYKGQTQYGPLKAAVADEITKFLESFQVSLANVDEQKLLAKLASSESAMNEVANATLLKVQKAVGLRP